MNKYSVFSFLRRRDAWARASGQALIMLATLLATSVSAAPVLEAVDFASLPGNRVQIDLTLSESTSPPETFATDSPARIALDFQGVENGLAAKTIPIRMGAVHSLAAVEAGDRTRVVVNLDESMPYQVTTRGERVTIALNSQEPAAPVSESVPSTASPPARPRAAPTARQTPREHGSGIRDIEFRRGSTGEGRVLVKLPSPDTRIAVREAGEKVIVELVDTRLPERLVRRLDVTDFATPVVAVESRPKGGNAEIGIETSGEYDYLAYQTDDLFTLEFRELTPAEKQELEQRQVVYSGDRLTLNFQDIEVRAVLQLLADFTGLNMVASDTVTGNITLRLKNVPWDQALDIILKTKGLSKRQTGNVIMIAPTPEIAAQEELELKSRQTIEELAPLRSEFIQVNYAKATDFAGLLKSVDNRLISDRGHVSVDPRTNTLIVRDTAKNLEDVRGLVQRLDVPVRQVLIESRVVIANDDFARDLGVRFGFTGSTGQTGNNELLVGGGLPGYLSGTAEVDKGPFMRNAITGTPYNTAIELPTGSGQEALLVNLPANAPAGAVNLLLGKVGSYLLQLELSAMQREGRGEIISSPRVITSDQHQATIKVGQEIPYQERTGQGNTSTAFKDAVLQLDVTPHITPDDRIIMDLKVNKDNADYTNLVNGVPPLDTRSVETKVLVDNGETLVLGGVFEREKTFQREQVPWLGSVPVLGHLFRNTARVDNNNELLVFVTPKIVKSDLQSEIVLRN